MEDCGGEQVISSTIALYDEQIRMFISIHSLLLDGNHGQHGDKRSCYLPGSPRGQLPCQHCPDLLGDKHLVLDCWVLDYEVLEL